MNKKSLIVKLVLILTIFSTLNLSGEKIKPQFDNKLSLKVDELRQRNDQKLEELVEKLKYYELVPKN
jgi:hypothetical protein